ncbi:MAG: hypothetical protein U5R31_17165 [Acidimicrobiia bacterium]|nr:hypothetical protein [Acidimicrobiia bacterium]
MDEHHLQQVIIDRFPAEDLKELVADYRKQLPWDDWAILDDQIGDAVRGVDEERSTRTSARPTKPSMGAPIEEVLGFDWGPVPPKALIHRLVNEATSEEVEAIRSAALLPWERRGRLPFLILGRRNDPSGLSIAEEVFSTNTKGAERASSLRYICDLGAETTLPIARRWLGSSDERSGVAARLMALHSEARDVDSIRISLSEAWENRWMYPLCDLMDALARHRESGPFPELRQVFEEVGYSYARSRAATALAAVDPEFPDTFAVECSRDCESETWRIGAQNALPTSVWDRLTEMASDPCESTDVVAAASERLADIEAEARALLSRRTCGSPAALVMGVRERRADRSSRSILR